MSLDTMEAGCMEGVKANTQQTYPQWSEATVVAYNMWLDPMLLARPLRESLRQDERSTKSGGTTASTGNVSQPPCYGRDAALRSPCVSGYYQGRKSKSGSRCQITSTVAFRRWWMRPAGEGWGRTRMSRKGSPTELRS